MGGTLIICNEGSILTFNMLPILRPTPETVQPLFTTGYSISFPTALHINGTILAGALARAVGVVTEQSTKTRAEMLMQQVGVAGVTHSGLRRLFKTNTMQCDQTGYRRSHGFFPPFLPCGREDIQIVSSKRSEEHKSVDSEGWTWYEHFFGISTSKS